MKRVCLLSLLIAIPACSGDDSTPPGLTNPDSSLIDSTTPGSSSDDSSAPDAPVGTVDATAPTDASDAAPSTDASDGASPADAGCPTSWTVAPVVDPSIAVPDGGVLLHALGSGTQDYVCTGTTTDAGTTYAWTLVTPDAVLSDCHASVIGHHFASEAGAGFPEWQTGDGTYVIGTKHLPTFTPDGGAGSVPWLLLNAVDAGGAGTLAHTTFIQRLNTDGGNAPSTVCGAGNVGAPANVGYTADYYFFGP